MPDIKGVEIMSEGIWNNTRITKDVMNDVIAAFNQTKEFALPHLKLGHNDNQPLLENDGLPAAGWVTNVYIKGKKLLADFSDVPEKIYSLIMKKAYRKVSVELFQGYKFKGNTFNNLLGAVALLGADRPAMANLNDILSMYSLPDNNGVSTFTNPENADTIKTKITMTAEAGKVPDNKDKNTDSEDLRKKITDLQEKLDKQSDQFAEFSKERESFQSYRDKTDAKIKDLENEKVNVQVKNFCLDLSTKELISPSMEPYVAELVKNTSAKKFSVGDKKDVTAQVLIEDLLGLAKQVYGINKDENTENILPKDDGNDDDASEEISKFMSENKVDYSQAYKEVMKKRA